MANETENVDSTNNETELDLDLDVETTQETLAEKPKESLEAKKARLEGILKRINKDLGAEDTAKVEPKSESKGELDYGQKAYLNTYGIKGSDELQLVREYLSLGKSLDDIPSNKHFLNDLEELRDARLARQAIPAGTQRTNQSARDSVEYWIAKGELPPENQVQLRRDVLNARIKQEKDSGMFSKNPIVMT